MTNSIHGKEIAKGQDLGPLAWVLGEMRQTYDRAMERLQTFANLVAQEGGASIEQGEKTADLEEAKKLIHQACGALEMVGAFIPAFVLRHSEHAVTRMVSRPQLCTTEAVQALSQSGLAVGEYLENLLVNPTLSPVLLFPTYRKVHALLGVSPPASPADLWHLEGELHEPELDMPLKAIAPSARVRQMLDQSILNVVKGQNEGRSGRDLVKLCLGLSLSSQTFRERTFWKVAAGFFEALSLQRIPNDIYVKRAATRVLVQYASLIDGDALVTARWMQDLLFFCSQARDVDPQKATVLHAVRHAFGLEKSPPVDYDHNVFSLMVPAEKQEILKALKDTTEGWSAVMEGQIEQADRVRQELSSFSTLVSTHMPVATPLVEKMVDIVSKVKQTQAAPTPELAMELATTILYFQALLEDVRIRSDKMPERIHELTLRLREVEETGHAKPLPVWVEELYTRVSDSETIGSVVSELRASLSEAENHLDRFFRDPADTTVLQEVPGILGRARGVLAVLGLVPATKAVQQINADIRELIEQSQEEQGEALSIADERFEKIGSNLGALGLQVDMLASQPTLSKELFVFDATTGRLQPLMGRLKVYEIGGRDIFEHVQASQHVTGPVELDEGFIDEVPDSAQEAASASSASVMESDNAAQAPASIPETPLSADIAPAVKDEKPVEVASPADEADESDDELLEIFLEEAREVIRDGRQALTVLGSASTDVPQQTILRRAFHTLKGSSRMVGLDVFGNAAWAMEQLMNGWLAEQKPFSAPIHQLCTDTLEQMAQWIQAIEARADTSPWSAQPFEHAAQVMRAEQRYVPVSVTDTPDESAQELRDEELLDLLAEETSDAPDAPEADQAESMDEGRADDAADEWDLDTQAIDLGDWEGLDSAKNEEDVAPLRKPAEAAHSATDSSKLTEAIRSLDAFDLPDLELDLEALEAQLPPGNSEKGQTETLSTDFAEGDDWIDETVVAALPADKPEVLAEETHETEVADPWESTIQESFDDAVTKVADLSLTERADLLGALPRSAPSPAPQVSAKGQAEDLDATETLLHALESSLAQSEEDAERWGVSFKETEIAFTPSEAQEHLTAPAASLVADASLLADLDALVAEEQVVQPPSDDATKDASINDEISNDELNKDEPAAEAVDMAPLAPEEDLSGPESAAQLAQGLIEVGQDDETYWLLQALQLTQELEDQMNHWAEQQPSLLAADAQEQVHSLVEVGTHLEVDSTFGQYLETIEQVVTFLGEHHAAEPEAVRDGVIQGLQQVQTAMDGIVAGIGNGAIEAKEFATLEAFMTSPVVVDAAAVSTQEDLAALDVEEVPALQDVVDPDLFPIFEEEAIDLMPRLVGALRRWMSEPQSFEARSESLRVLHTLKGSSRLAGARQMGEMAHRFESDIEAIEAKVANAQTIGLLLAQYDEMQAAFDALRVMANAQEEPVLVSHAGSAPVLMDVARARAVASEEAEVDFDEPRKADASETADRAAIASPAVRLPQYVPEMGESFGVELPGPSPLLIQNTRQRQQTVRVRSAHINRLINQAGEIQISRSRAESRLRQLNAALDGMTVDLDRLRHQLRELEVQSESQMQSRMALGKDSANFDPLELDRFTRVQELTRMMAETVNDVATVQRTLQAAMVGTEDDLVAQERKGRELQRDLLHTRMVEFDSVAERLHSVVRQASAATGKKASLVIENGRIEMDRVLLDRMLGGFEHILRNCVDHGIESAAVRQSNGKSASGTITLTVNHEGNDVSISFKDDGAGLDLEAIRRKGVERGLIGAGQIVSDKELSNLIFMPGFTTASELTGISGRGIGMDVVRVDVSALGGRIETSTELGKGTTFRLIMPLTTAVTQVMLVRSGSLIVGVPANLVDGIERVSLETLQQGYQRGQIDIDGRRVPFYWSGALLQHSPRSQELSGKTFPLVMVRSAAQIIALHVDEVLGNQEVVVKNLGAQLSLLPGLAGMSVLASGAVLLVYNFIALSSVYGETAKNLQRDEVADTAALIHAGLLTGTTEEQETPLVLVVDDSITVRRVTQRLLKREGYRVALAAHGGQALELLAQETPTVMLSDIEMPQMDGFELLRQVRADARYAGLPVVMITSRTAQKHRDHAMELGANHYLGKPYSDAELLALVHEYAQAPDPTDAKAH